MVEIERIVWTPEQRALWDRIAAHPFERSDHALDFTARLARDHGWDLPFARDAIEEYRRFCFLAALSDTPVTPSEEIDVVWHQHLTYSRDYWEIWCKAVLRVPLHHDPTAGGPVEGRRFRAHYADTLALYEAHFGPPDPLFWPGFRGRFRDRPRYRAIDGDRVFVLPRPRFLRGRFRGVIAVALPCAFALTAQPAQALPLDPLDGRGPDLLALYLFLAIGGLILALILGNRLRVDTQDGLTPDDLELLEVAWLAGGEGRAVRTVVAGLIEAGAAHLTPKSTLLSGPEIRVEPRGDPLPDFLAPFRGLVQGHVSQGALHRSVRERLPPLRAELERRGLVPAAALRARTVRTVLLVLGPVVLFGIAGALTEASHRRPIGALVLAILVTIALGALLIAQLPDRTERGEGTLNRYRSRFRRAAEAPRSEEVLFAFALGGGAALTGTHLQAYGRRSGGGGDGGFAGVGCGGGGGSCGGGCGGGACG
ncbi:TIGR04222 domain-containing membrane protein [Methylorubrum sp. POS3]|uniref:TIGR04222 domain-containing membrane protein n=1 Tax=Methylorubrum sp. POS3 TaxID=2998492 RepID=UPI00372BA4BB